RIVLCLLAFDVWILEVPLGWRYGMNGFNVAHFAWLDALQPLPSPALYVGMMLATGVVALVCAFRDTSRWTRVLLLVLYTYGWMMSLLDIFQHHYLLSLILTMFVFFPRARLVDLYRAPRGTEPRPAVETWAYVLLGATMFIVYVYT